MPAAQLERVQRAGWELRLKRGFDIVVSFALLILLAPVFLLLALIIRATSRGPAFHRWEVVGLRGREFDGYKFRTMRRDADDLRVRLLGHNVMDGPVFKMKRDPRVTPFGRLLRKFSVDELPQLWSVLKGDMSLVGPRPPLRTEVAHYEPWQWRRLSVTPGLTCLWQVYGRNHITSFDEWVRMDLKYIDTWSFWLDFKILLRTIPAVLKGTGW